MPVESIMRLDEEWPWNPNHKIKFYSLVDQRWLFRVTFSNKDQSLYLTPLYDRDFAVWTKATGYTERHTEGQDFHLSLHESGVVNLTSSSGSVRLREIVDDARPIRHVATIQFNSIAGLPETSLEEINTPRGGYAYLPVVGFPGAPIMLSILCSTIDAGWSPPPVGNSFLLHSKTRMANRTHCFHFVLWQDLGMPAGAGDLGLSYGDEWDTAFGLKPGSG